MRIYDNTGTKPATPSNPVTSVLLAEFDLLNASWSGSPATLSSTHTAQVQVDGFPLFARFTSDDGLTNEDVDYVLPPNSVDATQELQEDNPPDAATVQYPGPWLAGTDVTIGPGDLIYAP
jgi:hypothetical protein